MSTPKPKTRPSIGTRSYRARVVEDIRITLGTTANVILASDRATSRAIGIVRQSGLDRSVQRRIIGELTRATDCHQTAINALGAISTTAINAGVWR